MSARPGLFRFVRERLHRRIFLWFGASIAATGATVWVALSLATPGLDDWRDDWARFQGFVGRRFAEVWDEPDARARLARQTADELHVRVTLEDPDGDVLARFGEGACTRPQLVAPVVRGGDTLGQVEICAPRAHERGGWLAILGLGVALATLWGFSGVIARRLARPLGHVVRVARDIGHGRLGSRTNLGAHKVGELATLADAIDDMACRIERQLRDQRELLAAVSHEIRTPLGHIRILLETARDAGEAGRPIEPRVVDELEAEVLEIDDLVGELLASSRLTFAALDARPLEALDVAARALERAGLSLALLGGEAESVPFEGDATLLGRALANLLENARRHAGGATRLVVDEGADEVRFVVEDAGPGLAPGDDVRVFESFYRGEQRAGATGGSLGLGLSLVRRIAEAHGGRAWAEPRPGGGARIGFSVARTRPADAAVEITRA